jgi:hypothetical protein
MPYKMEKVSGGGYSMKSPHGTKAKHTTKKKAVAQIRLLNMKEHGITPKGGWHASGNPGPVPKH